ncbi:MAG: flippase-like domain-containing protein [Nitrospirae bacterium]|nr:flippase-like domain-containing protein [Nitrospirota bacterium]MBI5694214.1 flippase-like domain-containing protein [Nitrospirota bacterium]
MPLPEEIARPAPGKYIAGSLVSLLVILLLAWQADVAGSLSMLARLEPGFLVFCALAYSGVYLARALRFRALLAGEGIAFTDLLSVVSIHNLLNMLMPLRSGEVSFFLLLKKVSGVGYSKGAASLLLSRLYDLVTFFFLVAVFAVSELMRRDGQLVYLAVLYPVAGGLYLLLFRKLEPALSLLFRGLDWAAGAFGKERAFMRRASGHLSGFRTELASMTSDAGTVRIAACSLLVWLLNFWMFHEFVSSLEPGVSFFQSSIGSSGAVLTTMLPVNSPGSVGTLEGGWTLGYVLAGVDKNAALASGILMHVFVIAFGTVLAALAAARLGAGRFFREGP